MNPRRIMTVGAAVASVVVGGVLAATPASADVSQHCQEGGYCLFSGANFTGTKVVLEDRGCHQVSELGFTPARSAARGFGDGLALQLFSDGSCGDSLGFVFDEVSNTNARSYLLMFVPG